jgi:hypothetical protein
MEEDIKQFNLQVRAKAGEKDPKEKARILKQMVFFTDDRNKAIDEYTKIKTELGLRYPNQGEHLNRQYRTQVKKTVQELEGAAGLDEILTRTKKVVDKKYAPFNDPKEEAAPKAKVAEPQTEEKPERLRLEK